MKRFLLGIAVGALALGSVTTFGATSASAAATVPTVVLSGGSAVFGISPGVIKATASVPGTVNFTFGNASIKDCAAVATTTTSPFVATCTWTPIAAGPAALGATLTPTDTANYATAAAPVFTVTVGTPVQGATLSPVSIYADTINTTSDKGVFAPRFGNGCSITSEFIVGQTIVFRVFGNSADLGGAALTPLNVSSATVTVAGMATPLTLSYGNHGGAAFWTAVLKTGSAAGQYGTLGVINYKVTMVTIAVPAVTKQVKATKFVATLKNGKQVVVDGKKMFHQVSYTKAEVVTPAIPGATGVFQPNFTPLSQLTLNALPA